MAAFIEGLMLGKRADLFNVFQTGTSNVNDRKLQGRRVWLIARAVQ